MARVEEGLLEEAFQRRNALAVARVGEGVPLVQEGVVVVQVSVTDHVHLCV